MFAFLVAAVAVVGLASAASAGTVNVRQNGTGLATISANVGDSIVVDILLTRAVVAAGYGFEVGWDGGATPLLSVLNPDLNNGGDILEFLPPGFTFNASVGVDNFTASAASTSGNTNDIEALTFSPAGVLGTAVARITFKVLAPGSTTVFALLGTGDTLGDGSFTQSPLTINVIPEPATASLLGLGLLGLVFAGRRHRRS
jgi:hypothetical protein